MAVEIWVTMTTDLSVKPSVVIEEEADTQTHSHSIDPVSGFQQYSGQLTTLKVVITGVLALCVISGDNKDQKGTCAF